MNNLLMMSPPPACVSISRSLTVPRSPLARARSTSGASCRTRILDRIKRQAMNKNVVEAARRVFGHLPHSNVRSGNKALRKNIIGQKIVEYYPQTTAPNMVKMAEREIPGIVMDHKKEWRRQKREMDEGTSRGASTSKTGQGK